MTSSGAPVANTAVPNASAANAASVVARLIRFWDSRNINKNNEFMGITIILLDELARIDSMIHCFIPANRSNHYWNDLKTGSIIRLDNFEVARVAHMYKITEHQFVIRFLPSTRISEVETDAPIIKFDRFMFAGFRESLADDLYLAKLAMECGVGVFTKTAAEYERRRENFEVVFADVVIILLCLCVHVRSQEWSETYYSIRSFEIVRGFPVTSRRLDSHGMVEENRGEAALPSARPVLEMTAECGGANSSEH
ncbi:unnamed protein product, partial [Brassica napus]